MLVGRTASSPSNEESQAAPLVTSERKVGYSSAISKRERSSLLLHFRKRNLMDHVMNTLENYASSLETEVEQRMVELTEEKKKSDILLYRMLPK